jgi:hypothetical protein
MSEASPNPIDKAAVQRLMRRVEGFARGLGLDDASARRIVEAVVADMPSRLDEERVAEARVRMITAAE